MTRCVLRAARRDIILVNYPREHGEPLISATCTIHRVLSWRPDPRTWVPVVHVESRRGGRLSADHLVLHYGLFRVSPIKVSSCESVEIFRAVTGGDWCVVRRAGEHSVCTWHASESALRAQLEFELVHGSAYRG